MNVCVCVCAFVCVLCACVCVCVRACSFVSGKRMVINLTKPRHHYKILSLKQVSILCIAGNMLWISKIGTNIRKYLSLLSLIYTYTVLIYLTQLIKRWFNRVGQWGFRDTWNLVFSFLCDLAKNGRENGVLKFWRDCELFYLARREWVKSPFHIVKVQFKSYIFRDRDLAISI